MPISTKHILYGTIAVCESWTFTTDCVPFCIVLEELKNESVPERFREAIAAIRICRDPILPASDEADRVFRNLGRSRDGLAYIFDDRRGGEAPYCGLRFIWEDKDAIKYIKDLGFTTEELDWLWSVALRLHNFGGSVPERRAL